MKTLEILAGAGLALAITTGCTNVNSLPVSDKQVSYGCQQYNFDIRDIAGKKYTFLKLPEGKTVQFGKNVIPQEHLAGYMLVPLDNQQHKISRGTINNVTISSPDNQPYFLTRVICTEKSGETTLPMVNDSLKPSTVQILSKALEKEQFTTIGQGKARIKTPYSICQAKFDGRTMAEVPTTDTVVLTGTDTKFDTLPVMYLLCTDTPETTVNTATGKRTDSIRSSAVFRPIKGILVDSLAKPKEDSNILGRLAP